MRRRAPRLVLGALQRCGQLLRAALLQQQRGAQACALRVQRRQLRQHRARRHQRVRRVVRLRAQRACFVPAPQQLHRAYAIQGSDTVGGTLTECARHVVRLQAQRTPPPMGPAL